LRKSAIIVASIGAAGVIIAAVIQIYPALLHPEKDTTAVVAGIVVGEGTNKGIGQATITLAGRPEKYVTEDNGNFRIEIRAKIPESLRLHVDKAGFLPLDTTTQVPAADLVLQLRKQ
jgi:hypothetical protein